MSSIDERIVQMRFNNDQFEKGIKTTTDSLGKLKDSLKFDSVKNSLSFIPENIKRISFDHLSQGLDAIKNKFTALSGAAVIALGNIATSAIQTGLGIAKSLTIQPIIQGYADYNSKLTSIQTITAATGKSIKEVEVYFDELDKYADKTIYNLSDMTGAMAKFVNAGVSLDTAVPAIKGISNMTALAGQDANAARIAYYNLSQSIAGGFLTTIDYKSLNLANIATKEWKGQMIKAAVAAKTLKKGSDGLYHIPGAKKAYNDAQLFTEGLSTQWATTKVLLNVLGDYGDTTTAIGAKAQASAQDIKSLGMMMETLKASVGTGWTDTFQIVIGDLEESKKLWTGLTSAIQSYIDMATEARNNLLQGWKDLGGRTALIDAFGNVFKSIIDIFKAVSTAFNDIFPPMTSKRLYDITMAFKNFTEGMKQSSETLTNLKRTLRGIFAVFGIVWEIVKAVGRAFFDLIGYTTKGSSSILNFTGNIGDFLYAIYKALKAGDGLGKFFTGIAAIIKIPIAIIKTFVAVLGALLEGLNKLGASSITTATSKLKDNFKPLSDIGTKLSDIWNGVMKTFEKVSNFFKPVLTSLANLFGNIGKTIASSFTNANYDSALNTINTGLFGGLIFLIKRFFDKGFIGLFDGGFVSSFKTIFNELGNTLKAFTASLKAKTLVTIAIALALLTASVIGLSLVDPVKLTSALAAMTIMITQLMVTISVFSEIAGSKGIFKLPVIAQALILLSISVGILTSSVIRLSGLSWGDLIKGLVGVTAILGALVRVTQTMGAKTKGMIGAGIAMIAIATAVKILASALADFAKLSWEQMTKGLVGVGVVLTQISIFNKFASASRGAIKNGVGLILLAAGIKILASAVGDFGAMDIGALQQGLWTLTGVLALITIFSKVTKNGSSLIGIATGMVILGASLKIFAGAIAQLGAMSWENLIKGLTGMAATLLIVAVAMRLMPTNMLVTAISLVVVAAALTIMANALSVMGGMTWDEIGRGLTLLAGSLGVLALALYLMSGALPGAAALIVAAGALAIMAPALKMFGKMSWEEIGKGLVMLAGSLVIIAAAGYLLIGALPGLLGLGVAAVLVGIGALAAGAGVMLLSIGLVALAAASVVGTAAMVSMVSALIGLIPYLMLKIGEGLINIVRIIAASSVEFIGAFTTVLSALIIAIAKVTPLLIQTIMNLITLLLTKLRDNVPKFVILGMELLTGVLEGFASKLPDLIAAGTEVIMSVLQGVQDNLPKIIDQGIKTVISFIGGIASGIKNNTAKFVETGSKLFRAIVDGIAAAIKQGGKDIQYAGKTIGDALLQGAMSALGINSPSKEFYKLGVFSTEGIVNGLSDTSKIVGKAGADVGNSAVDGLNKSISRINDISLSNIDMNPTIRPVLDLSAIKSDSAAIDSLLTPSTLSVDAAYAQAASIAVDQRTAKVQEATQQAEPTPAANTNISFVQNNNSPKALSPAEIYRQTKNQIAAARGIVAIA